MISQRMEIVYAGIGLVLWGIWWAVMLWVVLGLIYYFWQGVVWLGGGL